MKKLKVNKKDASFINKETFEDKLQIVKSFGECVINNWLQLGITVFSIGTVFISGSCLFGVAQSICDVAKGLSANTETPNLEEKNDEIISQIEQSSVLVAGVPHTLKDDYVLIDRVVYHKDGTQIDLNGSDLNLYLIGVNIDRNTLEALNFKEANSRMAGFNYSSIQDDFLEELPNTIEVLDLSNCHYIKDLSLLPKKAPNLKSLCLNNVPLLKNLNFLYELPFLEEVQISESACVTMDLLDYFKRAGIKTNITVEDVLNSRRVDEIVEEIIKPGMSDEDKIRAVTLYVLNNLRYDFSMSHVSNRKPLSCALNEQAGVCASYAYFTAVLLNKANVKVMEITSDTHGWNLVEVEGNYSYIDTTNIDGSFFFNKLLSITGFTKYYMMSPGATFTTSMSNPNEEVTIIPYEILEDINKQLDEESIFQKYGTIIGNVGVLLCYLLIGAMIAAFPFVSFWTYKNIKDLNYSIKKSYNIKKLNSQKNNIK